MPNDIHGHTDRETIRYRWNMDGPKTKVIIPAPNDGKYTGVGILCAMAIK